jgi:threonine dehydrogenase-like Zn-dependent dehydrogenase
MPRAYAITAEAIAAERRRVDNDLNKFDASRVIALDDVTLRTMGPRDVHLRILAVSLEHNVDHAVLADTVNITELRGGKIYPGNSALGEVIAVGDAVTRFKPGDIVVTHCNGEPDIYGYPMRIWAYDQPESIGWYGEEAVVGDWQIVPAPLACGLNLWEIAALPLRAPTAYHLWRRGHDIFRIKVPREKLARLTCSASAAASPIFLMGAPEGHRAFFYPAARRVAPSKLGIADRSEELQPLPMRGVKAFPGVKRSPTAHRHASSATCRGGVRAGIAAAAREGVNVSAGWQLDKKITYDSAGMSVKQITLDHTHYDTIDGCNACTELYGVVYKPTVHEEIYPFAELPRALREMHQNTQTGIPIIRVAAQMPAAVQSLIR